MSARVIGGLALVAALSSLGPAALSHAQAESQSMGFEAASEAQTENVPGGTLLLIAYGFVWVLLLGYVGSIGYRQSALSRALEQLRADLDDSKKD